MLLGRRGDLLRRPPFLHLSLASISRSVASRRLPRDEMKLARLGDGRLSND